MQNTELKPCSKLVEYFGTCIFITDSIAPQEFENWIEEVRKRAGRFVLIDWHYFGGHQRVCAFGLTNKARAALIELKGTHDRLWRTAMKGLASSVQSPGQLC